MLWHAKLAQPEQRYSRGHLRFRMTCSIRTGTCCSHAASCCAGASRHPRVHEVPLRCACEAAGQRLPVPVQARLPKVA